MMRIVLVVSRLQLQHMIHLLKFAGCVGHFCRRSVTWFVRETCEGKIIGGAATLMVNAQCIGARESSRNCVVDNKWKRSAQAGNPQPVFTRCFVLAEISFQYALVRR